MKKEGKLVLILSIILVLILSGVLFLISSGYFGSSNPQTSEEDVGENFSFTALDGSEKHLSDYRGKVVILDLWATWCVPCQIEMIELKKIYENYSRDDLEIISVDITPSESIQLIQSYRDGFAQYYGIELDWIFGKDNGSISEKYMNEGAIPTLAIFDQNGRLHFREAGVCVFMEIPAGLPSGTTLLAPILNDLIK